MVDSALGSQFWSIALLILEYWGALSLCLLLFMIATPRPETIENQPLPSNEFPSLPSLPSDTRPAGDQRAA